MKKTIKIITGIFVIVILSVFVLQIDDDWNPEAQKWVDEINTEKESEAYLFLLGIDVGENDSPIEIGRKRHNAIIDYQNNLEVEPLNYNKILLKPDGDIYCQISYEGCLKKMFEQSLIAEKELVKYSVLLNRYDEFLSKKEFKIMTKADYYEPYISLSYITSANRVILLKAINFARNKEIAKSIEALLSNISKLKQSLYYQDSIFGKIVFLGMITENINVISVISNKYNYVSNIKINPISKKELNIVPAIKREFVKNEGVIAYLLNDVNEINRKVVLFSTGGGHIVEETEVPEWINKILFKPNMTSNYFLDYVKMHIKLDGKQLKDNIEYSQLKEKNNEKISFRNLYGRKVLRTGIRNINYSYNRLYNVNNKIKILNKMLPSKIKDMEKVSITNYDGETFTPKLNKKGNKLCFPKILLSSKFGYDDERNCLLIKI